MTFDDLVRNALGNLWRMKLRTVLTTSGVVIAIGAFVSMLSFGAGNRELVTSQFEELGLFTTMHVYPRESEDGTERVLNDDAVLLFASIPGVKLAYPFDDFEVAVSTADTALVSEAQALPPAALETRMFSGLVAGALFGDSETGAALVTEEFIESLGLENPADAVGLELELSVQVASADSAFAHAMRGTLGRVEDALRDPTLDALSNAEYVAELQARARDELGDATARFIDGYLTRTRSVTDTVIIRGVLKGSPGRRIGTKPILLPTAVARRLSVGRNLNDPTVLMSAVQDGSIFRNPITDDKHYPRITLDLAPTTSHQAMSDSVEALGFRAFSFAREFDEIRRFFILFNLALSGIGLIALVTAALGIVNTMMMSISERRREIGILRALGADENVIRIMFLVESSVIGALGATAGIALGWLVSRLGSFIAQMIMEREGVEPLELFATPWWLVLVAMAFGIVVSLLAGLYPAARAARVDPVQALRQD